MDWEKLQNGSDIRGIALDGIPDENVNLTPAVVTTIAKAFVTWLRQRLGKEEVTLAIGTDSRISGPALKNAFIKGITEVGLTIYDCGLASTPAMFMTTVDKENPVTAGVMITASHLPFNRNGIKFFVKDGGLEKEDIAAILDLASKKQLPVSRIGGKVEAIDFMAQYTSHLVEYICREVNAADYEHPLSGMHIIVDAGNGDGGFFVDRVLNKLGADTMGSQFLEPDGHFPNHIPNPENPDAMASICRAVAQSHADMGIIFDTDVDRSAIVDKAGEPINRNTLIALIATVILREHKGSTIVTDSVTSDGLSDFIVSKGGRHHRFKRGYRNVIDEGIRLNHTGEECWLAIETSGHAALRENYFLDDGAYLVAKLIVEAARLKKEGKELQDLIRDLKQPVESTELRYIVTANNVQNYGQHVLDGIAEAVKSQADWKMVIPNYEGIRVSCTASDEQGWFLLRKSLHDPVLPLNIESNVKGGVEHISRRICGLLEKYDKLKK